MGLSVIPLSLGVICAGSGAILAFTLVSQFSRFGSDSPYVSNLLAKMGMERRTEAAVYAARLSERRRRGTAG